MAAVSKGPALRVFWKMHRWLLRVTRARFFARMGPGRQLLLITTGRKSLEPRSVGLTYLTDAERFIVIASNVGEDTHPAWWLNLLANPAATVMVAGASIPVTSHELGEPERSEMFSRFVTEIHESYREYERRTSRRMPVVALTRVTL